MTLWPVLAETLKDGQAQRYIGSDDWCAEQKLDGQRILIHVGGTVVPLNRKAEPTAKDVPRQITALFSPLIGTGEWYFDGELIGVGVTKVLWLFDLPYVEGHIDTTDSLYTRKTMLDGFHAQFFGDNGWVKLLPTFEGADEKARLVERVQANGGEGVMFKHLDKPYEQPRGVSPKTGFRSRWILKAKNRKTIDCYVLDTKLDGKDNMQLGVVDPTYKGRTAPFRPIGECTALAGDKDKIQPGHVVEVTYLYANNPTAPRLYQPTMPRIRDDKAPDECTIDQLVFTNREVLV